MRWLPAYGASEVPVIAANPVDRPAEWRLDSAGLPPSGVELARGRPRRAGQSSLPGRSGRSRFSAPRSMSGYLPEEATADGLRRRLVPNRRRGLAGAAGLGPSHRPLEGDDQGQRLPGRAGGDRGSAPRTSCGPRLCRVRTRRREVRARCRLPSCSSIPTGRSAEDELREYVAGSLATYKQLRRVVFVDAIPRLPSGKVLRRTLRDEWTPRCSMQGGDGLMDVRLSPVQEALARVRRRTSSTGWGPGPCGSSTTSRERRSSKRPSSRRAGASCGPPRPTARRSRRGRSRPSSPRSWAGAWPMRHSSGPTLAAELRRLAGAPAATAARPSSSRRSLSDLAVAVDGAHPRTRWPSTPRAPARALLLLPGPGGFVVGHGAPGAGRGRARPDPPLAVVGPMRRPRPRSRRHGGRWLVRPLAKWHAPSGWH